MPSKTYRQVCSVARTLDLVGERWTLLIIRDLLTGPQSYSALHEGLPGLTTNLLAKRLRALQDADLVEALEVDDASQKGGARGLYGLTESGRALGPVLAALAEWGHRYAPAASPDATMNHRWLLLVLARHYRPTAGRWLVQLDSDGHQFQFRLGPESFESQAGAGWKADLVIRGAPQAIYDLFYGSKPPEGMRQAGELALEGPEDCREEAWADFQRAFGLEEA